MNREIKFRAWSSAEKKMVHWNNDAYMVIPPFSHRSDYSVIYRNIQRSDIYVHGFSGELMQYTGLKDKNGKEIYEGDIVKVYDWGFKTKENVLSISEVLWSDDEKGWDLSPNPTDGSRYDLFRGNWEVIGNIYENPELLGG
jgi:uncharacterized phage protein (TIGR01671 family)